MENVYAVEDVIRFTQNGVERVGIIEEVGAKEYQVRIYAEESGDLYPTDESASVSFADAKDWLMEDEATDEDIEELMKSLEIEIENELNEMLGEDEPADVKPTDEPEELKAVPIGLDDFVEYESEGGKVCGKITDILEQVDEQGVKVEGANPLYQIEVYEKQEDGFVPSGIMVEQEAAALKLCDAPQMGVMKRLPRFVGKMKKTEVTEESGIGMVKGYLSVFGNTDLGGDVVKSGAFKRSLEHLGGKTVFMLDHGYKTSEVLGVLELEEDERGLKMLGKINLKTSQGRDAFETIKFQTENGVPIGASIGYEPVKYNRNSAGGYDLEEVKLAEGSVTPFPMNTEAMITEASKRYNRVLREKRTKLFQTLKR
jgi:uncharacterized protein